jgi:hypothetical protein
MKTGWGLLAIFLFLYPVTTMGQEMTFDTSADGRGDTGYSIKWDSEQSRVVLFRDVSVATLAAARVFGVDGSQVSIFPLKVIPGAQFLDIWSADSTPNGGAVVAAIVGYGPRNPRPPIKSLLMTFDGGGNLTRLWNVEPYHIHHVAVDSNGNIFAIGDIDSAASYPMMTKYSPNGDVLAQFLPTANFKDGDKVIASGSRNGESKLFIEIKKAAASMQFPSMLGVVITLFDKRTKR